MTAYDEARAAGLAALHADSEWHYSDGTGAWRANYGRAVDLILAAALPYLTDDGATPFELETERISWHRKEGYEAGLPARGATPTIDRDEIQDAIYKALPGEITWHESLAAADAVIALIGGAS